MEASEYVTIAKNAACDWFCRPESWREGVLAFGDSTMLNAYAEGLVRYDSSDRFANAALAVVLTPENTASAEALARDLLSSVGLCLCGETLTVDGHDCKTAEVA